MNNLFNVRIIQNTLWLPCVYSRNTPFILLENSDTCPIWQHFSHWRRPFENHFFRQLIQMCRKISHSRKRKEILRYGPCPNMCSEMVTNLFCWRKFLLFRNENISQTWSFFAIFTETGIVNTVLTRCIVSIHLFSSFSKLPLLRYDVERSSILWSVKKSGEDDIETIAASPGEWDAKAECVQKLLRSHTKLSFTKWTKEAQKAALNVKVKFGSKVETVAVGDLVRIHRCKAGV